MRVDRRAFLRLAAALPVACQEHKRQAPPPSAPPPPPEPPEPPDPTPSAPAALLPPKPPIEHVVLIIKENRTYDALFTSFPEGVPGKSHVDSDPRCKDLDDDDDGVEHGRETALDHDKHLRCYHHPDAVAIYHAIARRFTLCARFFSEVRGPSYPNHLMLLAGQAPKNDDPADPPRKWACPKHCYDFPTFPDQFEQAGLSWKSYAQTGFVSSFAMIRHLKDSPNVVSWKSFQEDARAGRLPNLSYVFSDMAASEHPPANLCAGQSWTLRQLRALAEGPLWAKTAAFVVWDDWGGFHDHVVPPVVERDARRRPLRYGYRVPCLVVSPYAKRNYLSRAQHSHLSLLRFAESVFGLPPLNERVAASSDMGDCFDFAQPIAPANLPAEIACKKT